jgi:hypothetical protein
MKTATFVAAAFTILVGCGLHPGPIPSPTPFVVPSPLLGGPPCPAAPGQPELLSQLAIVGVHVNSASASTMQPIFKDSAVVCLMLTTQGPFEAAFFRDSAAATAVRVCLTQSGARYLYQINGQTVDSADLTYWTVVGTAIVSTSEARLDADFKKIPAARTPSC